MKNNNRQLINHITINTGSNFVVPNGKVWDSTVEDLKPLAIGGGGVIPAGHGQYRLLFNSEDSLACFFTIWKGKTPVLVCGFQEVGSKSDEMWEILINRCKASFAFDPKRIQKPSTPWLGVVILPTAFWAMNDLHWLADFEQCVAETWRRLSVSERSKISGSEEVMEFLGLKDIKARMNGEV
jgi:hypothetical protein